MTIEFSDTALLRVRPDVDPAVVSLQGEITGLAKYAESRAITCDADVKSATEDLSLMAKLKKALTDKRKEWLTPIKEKLDAVDAVFRSLSTPLDLADRTTRTKILGYRAEQERIRLAAEAIEREKNELAKREAALNGGAITIDLTPIEKPAEQPKHIRTEVGTATGAQIWKFEVVDFKALPDEYKMADEVKIGKVVRATKGSVSIPGVRMWPEESLRVNAR